MSPAALFVAPDHVDAPIHSKILLACREAVSDQVALPPHGRKILELGKLHFGDPRALRASKIDPPLAQSRVPC